MQDIIKFVVSISLVVAAIVVFYMFPDLQQIVRVLVVVAGVVIAGFILKTTAKGNDAWHFVRGSIVEVKKVVFPTGKETRHTTALVMVMVVIVGIILWFYDFVASTTVNFLIGLGGA